MPINLINTSSYLIDYVENTSMVSQYEQDYWDFQTNRLYEGKEKIRDLSWKNIRNNIHWDIKQRINTKTLAMALLHWNVNKTTASGMDLCHWDVNKSTALAMDYCHWNVKEKTTPYMASLYLDVNEILDLCNWVVNTRQASTVITFDGWI